MEAVVRHPHQGIYNIIRFNWHFYIVAVALVAILAATTIVLTDGMFWIGFILTTGIVTSTCISLLVSYYVYDLSGLYQFTWLSKLSDEPAKVIVNLHAGFDETSTILRQNFPTSTLHVFDFYDSEKHTELSIERARKAYPPFEGTIKIATDHIPLALHSVDIIFNIFALHEIRDHVERIKFLQQQVKALRNDGRCVVVEHLRDSPNFFAYNIGFLHFFSRTEWINCFSNVGLALEHEFKITPFITVFILKNTNGNTP